MKQYHAIVDDKKVAWECCPVCNKTKLLKDVDGVVTFLKNCSCEVDK